ncbi:MAG: hypothetical protein R3Y28_04800 [Candidatus Gastranaerophilales bacterium]
MQVQSANIVGTNVTGVNGVNGANSSKQNFQGKRERVDAMIRLDDNLIHQKAYENACVQVDDKSNKKTSKALMLTSPIAAGIATSVLADNGKMKFFGQKINGMAGRMGKGLAAATGLAAVIGTVHLVSKANNALVGDSKTVKEVNEKKPALAFVASVAASMALISAIPHGVDKISKIIPDSAKKAIGTKVATLADKINSNKTVDIVRNGAKNIAKKTPESLKKFGETILWSPIALIAGSALNAVNGSVVKRNAYEENYSNMKEKQVDLSRARLKEISNYSVAQTKMLDDVTKQKAEIETKYDVLMQKKKNREMMNLFDNPEMLTVDKETLKVANEIASHMNKK